MGIDYCLIANRHCILSEVETYVGKSNKQDGRAISNIQKVAHQLVQGLNYDVEEREALDCEGFTYCYMIEGELCYICVTDASFGHSAGFLFLKQVKKQFEEQFGARGKATKLAMDMQADFASVLKASMKTYSTDAGIKKLDLLKKDMGVVKESMQKNIDKVLERGDKVELLVDKTDILNFQSNEFAKSSRMLRRQMWLRNMKVYVLSGLALMVVLVLAFLYFKQDKDEGTST